MKNETTIAQGLRVSDKDAGYDAACKRILSEKAILARIMKYCLKEFENCDVNEIAEKFIEGQPLVSAVPVLPDESSSIIRGIDTVDKSIHEGTVTYDICFEASIPESDGQIGLLINIEAQKDSHPGYPLTKRGFYYTSRMLSAQYGREFSESHYGNLKKVYSIWICTKPPRYRQSSANRYHIVEEYLSGEIREPVENYDLMSVIILYLGGEESDRYSGIFRLLGVLLSSKKTELEKRKILEVDFGIQMQCH